VDAINEALIRAGLTAIPRKLGALFVDRISGNMIMGTGPPSPRRSQETEFSRDHLC
jgi:hypothetical protein